MENVVINVDFSVARSRSQRSAGVMLSSSDTLGELATAAYEVLPWYLKDAGPSTGKHARCRKMVMDQTLRFYSSQDAPIQGDAPISTLGKDPTIYLRGNALTFVEKKRKVELTTLLKGPNSTCEITAPANLPVSELKKQLFGDRPRLQRLFGHVVPLICRTKMLLDGEYMDMDTPISEEDQGKEIDLVMNQTGGGGMKKVKQESVEDGAAKGKDCRVEGCDGTVEAGKKTSGMCPKHWKKLDSLRQHKSKLMKEMAEEAAKAALREWWAENEAKMLKEQMAHPELTARQIYKWVKTGVMSADFKLPPAKEEPMPEAFPELSAADEDQQLRILTRQDRENDHEHQLETLRIEREREETWMRRELEKLRGDVDAERAALREKMQKELAEEIRQGKERLASLIEAQERELAGLELQVAERRDELRPQAMEARLAGLQERVASNGLSEDDRQQILHLNKAIAENAKLEKKIKELAELESCTLVTLGPEMRLRALRYERQHLWPKARQCCDKCGVRLLSGADKCPPRAGS